MAKVSKAKPSRGGGARKPPPRAPRPRASSEPGPRASSEQWPTGIPDSIIRAAERGAVRDETRRAVEREDARQEREGWTKPEPLEPGSPIEIREEVPAQEGAPAPAAAWTGVGVDAPAPPPGRTARRAAPRTAQPPSTDVAAADAPAYRTAAASSDAALAVEDLRVFYGAVQAIKGISFHVRPGETVAIIGSNGAGKTTTLKTVSGVSELLKTVRGKISILGERVESWAAHKIARLGVAHSPEGRKIFPNQTVRDNLLLGAYTRSDGEVEKDVEEQYQRFPILGERRSQPAGLMSGGEQQMLAMARALMSRPKIILLDEPSMGLAPLIVKQIFEIIEQLKREGKTILLVEQMAFQALGIADRAYVLETGAITMEGTGRELLEDPRVKEAYLGA